jgi:hypothetical protein
LVRKFYDGSKLVSLENIIVISFLVTAKKYKKYKMDIDKIKA